MVRYKDCRCKTSCEFQEYYDSVRQSVLQEIIEMLFDKHFVLGDIIDEYTTDSYTCTKGVHSNLKEKITKDINRRLIL